MKKIKYRIYRESELGESEFCGEYDSFNEAMDRLEMFERWSRGWHYRMVEKEYEAE